MRTLLLAATALFPLAASAATYTIVAPGTTPAAGQFASLNALYQAQKSAPFIQPGDEVDVQAGTYVTPSTEAEFWNIGTPSNPVTFKAIGGYVYLPSTGGVDKGELTFASSDVVVDGFIFAGNPGGASDNAAGIRLSVNYGTLDANGLPYPNNVVVKNSAFLTAADGILADDCSSSHLLSGQYGHTAAGIAYTNGTCSLTLTNDWFAGNGNGAGTDHQIYIDRFDQLTITGSLFMGGQDGHLVKSRAFNTDIENSRLIGGPFAIGNSLIDVPVGGNLTLKGSTLEIGRYNYNGFINYNEEAWPPTLNNAGQTIAISGNTFVDDWSATAGPSPYYYAPLLLWDDSTDTSKGTAPLAHAPSGKPATITFTGNHVYSHVLGAGNVVQTLATFGPSVDASNTFTDNDAAGFDPAIDATPPVAWPPAGTPMQTLRVSANGFPLPNGDGTYTDPQVVFWWNGLPLTPPSTVTADQTTGATQALTYKVPAIAGAPQFLAAQQTNGSCCLFLFTSLTATAGSNVIRVSFPNHRQQTGHIFTIGWGATTLGGITLPAGYQAAITVVDANTFSFVAPSAATSSGTASTQVYTSGANSEGDALNLLTASLGGGAPLPITVPLQGGVQDMVFPAGGVTPPPPVDTTPPVLATPAVLTVAAGGTAVVALSATDPDNTAAQLIYTEIAAPAHGTIEDGGVAATTWTQADLAAGRVTYVEKGTVAATDSVAFSVSDPAGNVTSGTLPIAVKAPVDTTPPVLATPATLTLVAGTSAPIVLSATDPDNTAAQLTYKITRAPAHGTIKDGGVAATTWTQADLAAGRVAYVETGAAATTDSIAFTVSDPAGNKASGTLSIAVKAPVVTSPQTIILAPGVVLIPNANGTWDWK